MRRGRRIALASGLGVLLTGLSIVFWYRERIHASYLLADSGFVGGAPMRAEADGEAIDLPLKEHAAGDGMSRSAEEAALLTS